MKTLQWSKFRLMNLKDVLEGPSLEITGDAEVAFYVIVKPLQAMANRVRGICSQIDASRGM